MGYKCINIVDGGIRRNRKINIWQKQLQPELFEVLEIEPASGKKSQRIWAKHKKTGLVTGFTRGKRLKEYRALILGQEEQEEVCPDCGHTPATGACFYCKMD